MANIIIHINNNRGKLTGDEKKLRLIQKSLKVRNPQAFYIRRYMPKGWDGYNNYITDAGGFNTGLLPQIIEKIKENEWSYKIQDERLMLPYTKDIPDSLGDLKFRGNQSDCVRAIINNKVGGIDFIRGIIKAATNTGKTLIMAGVYKATGIKTIIIVSNKDLFNQMATQDFPNLLPDEFGYMNAGDIKWGNLMICMAQTLVKRLSDPLIDRKLKEYGAVFVDEGDLSDNATHKKILSSLYTTFIRLCFSGSVLVSTLAKYKIKNQNIKCFFGSLIYEISNEELIDKGYSSKVKIIINKGNEDNVDKYDSFDEVYIKGVVKSKSRNKKIIKRLDYHMGYGRNNFLIATKLHIHVMVLYKLIKDKYPDKKVEWVHHTKKNRHITINKFKAGKIDILISSLIVKRGLNFPLMQVMINAAGGLSPENALQLLGRITRKNEDIDTKYFEDFYDKGRYIERHSKRRILVYKQENIPMMNLYKLR